MKIYFIGDIGNFNNQTKKIFKNIKEDSSDDDLLILLGDNFYPYGVKNLSDSNWNNIENIIFNRKNMYAVLGNHDYLGNIKCQIEYKNWNMEYNYFKKSFEKCDLFFVDTCILVPDYSNLNYDIVKSKIENEPLEELKKQIEWLENELSKSKKKIKIVVGHYPIFSFGLYGVNKKLFEILFPIFRKYNVQYYVSGHDHNLQIIDIITKDYSFKQLVSGASSNIYPIIRNCSNKVFSKYGYINLNLTNNTTNIIDVNNKILFTENIE